MKLIIFTGAPASGKSSIADEISKRLKISKISKDGFKIKLFEQFGFNNHDEKKKLSILGEKQMYECMNSYIMNNKDIIVDNNFKNFDEVRTTIKMAKTECKIICIYCFADYDILAKRYNDRITNGNRHPALYTLNKYPIINGISNFHPIITSKDVERIQKNVKELTVGENVLKINTNNIETEFKTICEHALKYINNI